MIEVQIPGQSNQQYPEALLRSLVQEGKVPSGWKARTSGTEPWKTVAELLNPQPVTPQPAVPPTVPNPPAAHPQEIRIAERYRHGQALVKGLEGYASTLESLGDVAAFLMCALAGAGAFFLENRGGILLPFLIAGPVVGLIVRYILRSKARLIRIQASLLAANIDTAIYTCPYLSETTRLALILPKS